MKKLLCLLLLPMLLTSGCVSPQEKARQEQARSAFVQKLSRLRVGMSPDEVELIIGPPLKEIIMAVGEAPPGATMVQQFHRKVDGITIKFVGGKLTDWEPKAP